MGEAMVRQQVEAAAEAGRLYPAAHPYTRLVRRIGERLARVTAAGAGGGSQGHLQGMAWEFHVIDSDEANAFVMPGGKVVVYRGLIELVRDVDGLAGVLAHEVGHAVARHVAERVTESAWVLAATALAMALGVDVSRVVALALTLPNSRRAEREADRIGTELMARACFNPEAMAAVFDALGRLEARGPGRPDPLTSTHPPSWERVRDCVAHLGEGAGAGAGGDGRGEVVRRFERAECREFRRGLGLATKRYRLPAGPEPARPSR